MGILGQSLQRTVAQFGHDLSWSAEAIFSTAFCFKYTAMIIIVDSHNITQKRGNGQLRRCRARQLHQF
jgi:hypothetical protein